MGEEEKKKKKRLSQIMMLGIPERTSHANRVDVLSIGHKRHVLLTKTCSILARTSIIILFWKVNEKNENRNHPFEL